MLVADYTPQYDNFSVLRFLLSKQAIIKITKETNPYICNIFLINSSYFVT